MGFADLYKLLFNPGEVTEIRALGLTGKRKIWQGWARDVVFGYFNNPDAFQEAAMALRETAAEGIYFTPNPVKPELLARAANRLKAAGKKNLTTADKDIACLRWLLIDLDPKRPAGISATDEELGLAIERRNRIGEWLKEKFGLEYAISAVSGNGAHLMVRLDDLENTQENIDLIRNALGALAHRWGDDQVDVDEKVFNPARIWKLYGTFARKGDSTPDRPHRKSYIQIRGGRNGKDRS